MLFSVCFELQLSCQSLSQMFDDPVYSFRSKRLVSMFFLGWGLHYFSGGSKIRESRGVQSGLSSFYRKEGSSLQPGVVHVDGAMWGDRTKAFSICHGHFHLLALVLHLFLDPPSLPQSPQPPGSIVEGQREGASCNHCTPPSLLRPLTPQPLRTLLGYTAHCISQWQLPLASGFWITSFPLNIH